MSAPAPSWNTVPVYGTWRNLDGSNKAGTAIVTFPVRVTNATDDVIVPAGTLRFALQTADPAQRSFNQPMPATDDPDNLPSNGWQATVTVEFVDGSATEVYDVDIPLAAATTGGVNLRTLIPRRPGPLPAPNPVWIIGGPGGLAEFSHTLQVVVHGNDPNVPRPAGAVVVAWCGDAEPVHAIGAAQGGYDFRIPATA